MTRHQYEQHKLRLEEQLRSGIHLLETAYQAQIRALELVWTLQVEAGEALPFISPRVASGVSRIEMGVMAIGAGVMRAAPAVRIRRAGRPSRAR